MSDPTSDEPIGDFDQTNGLAPGLEGDDGGAITHDEEEGGSPVERIGRDLLGGLGRPAPDDETGETPYSEEGQP